MLHIVCHDVANHFSVLSMCLELLERSPQRGLADYLPHMKAAVKNGISLTQMVREMRRSEDKVLELQPVPLRPVLQECLLLLQGRLQAKDLSVILEVADLAVLAERCALANSVFNNILTNAIKFSHPGGRIVLKVTEAAPMVCISIRDYGLGMTPAILENMFDMGRSHSRPGTAGEMGTGFGMPLMHRFVSQFGGRVEVSSPRC